MIFIWYYSYAYGLKYCYIYITFTESIITLLFLLLYSLLFLGQIIIADAARYMDKIVLVCFYLFELELVIRMRKGINPLIYGPESDSAIWIRYRFGLFIFY